MLKQLLNKNKPSALSQQNMDGKRKKNKLLQFKQDTNNPVLNEIMLQMRDKKKLAELGRNYVFVFVFEYDLTTLIKIVQYYNLQKRRKFTIHKQINQTENILQYLTLIVTIL
ncbi:Hypothetical_protein [Hexamita inflata]|uniref:Hypothetical_protein n=1 Tax=Hexamita inflata TaxID=28002 RepID=A0AA86UZM0_9EUKA|nr:Hypothetical protein HINF_LOCUS62339 [Hexamita inflata]